MGLFKPIYCRRSDGRTEIVLKGGKQRETNDPTPEQLDQRPDKHGVADYYRELGPDDLKSLDWRRKLGGMLARELDWKDRPGSDNGYMLVAFPENYRLYEHIKKTEKDGKTELRNKTHGGGGNDRQDAYLYGHPSGRRKRFRSPIEFFPHLLWLVTDEASDPDNCGCKVCSPEDLEAAIPGAKVESKRPVKQESEIVVATRPPLSMQRQSSMQGVKVKQESSTPAAKVPPTPTPLPKPKTPDQELDRQYYNFMYRPGELIWFQKGSAWGLGVVLRRWVTPSHPQSQYYYTVQPLSYPGHHTEAVTKASDYECRPWLAWSVPKFTHDGLNHLQDPPTYDTASWQTLSSGQYGHGELEVDASILAAKAIDATYTPFSISKTTQPELGVIETHYDGLYMGAERIWVGEPVRLNIGSGSDIMVVHAIVERKRASTTASPTLNLIGDIYSLASATHRPGESNPNIPTPNTQDNNPYLPPRMLEDLRIRNGRSIATKGTASYWKLIASRSKISLDEVKGRWYEATLIMPLLQPQMHDTNLRKGEVTEASLYMNSRGDCQNSNRTPNLARLPKPNIRKQTRKDAFGQAVPPEVDVQDGVEPPVDPSLGGTSQSMDIDPRFESATDSNGGQGGDATEGGFDELMNLDGMDTPNSMPGFGQEYGSQAPPGSYY